MTPRGNHRRRTPARAHVRVFPDLCESQLGSGCSGVHSKIPIHRGTPHVIPRHATPPYTCAVILCTRIGTDTIPVPWRASESSRACAKPPCALIFSQVAVQVSVQLHDGCLGGLGGHARQVKGRQAGAALANGVLVFRPILGREASCQTMGCEGKCAAQLRVAWVFPGQSDPRSKA